MTFDIRVESLCNHRIKMVEIMIPYHVEVQCFPQVKGFIRVVGLGFSVGPSIKESFVTNFNNCYTTRCSDVDDRG